MKSALRLDLGESGRALVGLVRERGIETGTNVVVDAAAMAAVRDRRDRDS